MRILLLANNVAGVISFRFEVVKAIIEQGHFITISAPFDKRMNELEAIGAKCVTTEIDRRSTNPVKDFMLICHYVNLIRKENQMWFCPIQSSPMFMEGWFADYMVYLKL